MLQEREQILAEETAMRRFTQSIPLFWILPVFLITSVACDHHRSVGGGGVHGYPAGSVVVPISGPQNGQCTLVSQVTIAQTEQVVWVAQDSDLTVMFYAPAPPSGTCTPGSGTPFVDANNNPVYLFPVHKGNSVASGNPKTSGCFKYAVAPTYLTSDPTKPTPIPGTACADPNVIVR